MVLRCANEPTRDFPFMRVHGRTDMQDAVAAGHGGVDGVGILHVAERETLRAQGLQRWPLCGIADEDSHLRACVVQGGKHHSSGAAIGCGE
jgi:hypothetical protein